MPLAYAELLMNGEPGTNVEISVLRLRKPEPQKITLTRSFLKYPPIVSKLLPDQVGMIQVQSMEAGKMKEIAAAVEQLQKQGAKRLVLDLRNAAVGKSEDGVALASLFMDKGIVTYLQGQKVARQDFLAEPSKTIFKLPLVLITNRGTANAAEIASAALLESKRAEIVGERTYGDAALRKPVTMDDGSAVILSVAKYYSPSGKAIQDVGVTPTYMVTDTEVPVDGDDENAPAPETPKKSGDDPLLKRAIDVLVNPGSQAKSPSPAPAGDAAPAVKNPLIKQ
jgi:carboxyl-terminal processing protease